MVMQWEVKLARVKHCGEAAISRATLNNSVYSKLSNALEEANKSYPPLHVFSFEVAQGNSRKFTVVKSLEDFYTYYSLLCPEERHFYEVIEYNHPCNLYFDIEFYFKYQDESVNVNESMCEFKKFVVECLQKAYNGIKVSNIIDLDSSTNEKFSRHVIFHTFDRAFKDNLAAGEFVKYLIYEAKCLPTRPNWFFKNEKGELCPFIDECVYSKNRCLRMFLSCKYGKQSVFVLSEQNSESIKNLKSYSQLLLSLVSVNRNGSVIQVTDFLEGPLGTSLSIRSPSANIFVDFSLSGKGADDDTDYLSNYFSSWLHEISGKRASVRPLKSSRDNERLIIYQVSGNRFCLNMKREHKSNGIFIVYDSSRNRFRQGCFDNDCKKFLFPWFNLPLEDPNWEKYWFNDEMWTEI